ncbi:MAG: pitrilysin family protein [candidate division WOR-3 bacterium]
MPEWLAASTLPGGLVIITERLPYVHSVALGITFGLGSRNDPDGSEGMVHLIEHMVFKGTERLSSRELNRAAEARGAELNGFTDKETTCFYGRFPADQCAAVTELLAEIVSAPAFNPEELKKEREVVLEEIRTTDEDPEAVCVNLLLRAVYGDQPLGRPVLGTVSSVSRIEAADLKRFYLSFYGCPLMVVTATGDVAHDFLVGQVSALLGNLQQQSPAIRLPASTVQPPQVRVHQRKDLNQVYVCLARPTFAFTDPRRHALSVMNTALGGGVSSRLFQRLREDEGLVYSVASFVELFQDSGLLGIYFVTDSRKLPRCLAALKEELVRLGRERIGTEEFERARNMTRSSVLLALESPTSRMMRLARTQLIFGRPLPVAETVAAYDSLALDEVAGLIDILAPDAPFHLGVVGPLPEDEVCRLIDEVGH